MKAGMVVQLRVSAKDCLAVLDLMESMGINPRDGRSFAQCTSLALSSMIQVMRDRGVIPAEEDGFQYLNRMAPFLNSRNDKRKRAAANTLYSRMDDVKPTPPLPATPAYTPPTLAAQRLSMDEETQVMLAEEMKELDDRRNDGGEWTSEEQERYNYLNKLLFS